MVEAWREAFEQATAGGASYFAWASDHDRWHPRGSRGSSSSRSIPAVVLAYPLTQRIDRRPAAGQAGATVRELWDGGCATRGGDC